jgi:hypothetical protein
MKLDENKENHKKMPPACRGQKTKWEIPAYINTGELWKLKDHGAPEM